MITISAEVSYSIVQVSVEGIIVRINLLRLYESKAPVREEQIIQVNLGQSEEEQIAQRMSTVVMKSMKESFEKQVTPFIVLTWEEYEKLGKPTVNDMIHATFEGDGK